MSSVTYQVSSVSCCFSPVTCHMSLTPTAIAMALALITPQLCTARCGCWSWSKPIDNESQRPKKSTIYALQFYHSWVKTAISDTNVISLLFLRESLCDALISMLTFKDGSNKTFLKLCVKKKIVSKTAANYEPIRQFWCLSRFRIYKRIQLYFILGQKTEILTVWV